VLSFCLKNICVLSFGDTIELLLRCTLVPLNFFQHDSLVITLLKLNCWWRLWFLLLPFKTAVQECDATML